MVPIDTNFEMQVRSGGKPGAAYAANRLPRLHNSTFGNVDCAQMSIDCADLIAVINDDHLAIPSAPTGEYDAAISTSLHGGAVRRRYVDTVVVLTSA